MRGKIFTVLPLTDIFDRRKIEYTVWYIYDRNREVNTSLDYHKRRS